VSTTWSTVRKAVSSTFTYTTCPAVSPIPMTRCNNRAITPIVSILVPPLLLTPLSPQPVVAKLHQVTLPMAVVTHVPLEWSTLRLVLGLRLALLLRSGLRRIFFLAPGLEFSGGVKGVLLLGRVSSGFLTKLGLGDHTCFLGGSLGLSVHTILWVIRLEVRLVVGDRKLLTHWDSTKVTNLPIQLIKISLGVVLANPQLITQLERGNHHAKLW